MIKIDKYIQNTSKNKKKNTDIIFFNTINLKKNEKYRNKFYLPRKKTFFYENK